MEIALVTFVYFIKYTLMGAHTRARYCDCSISLFPSQFNAQQSASSCHHSPRQVKLELDYLMINGYSRRAKDNSHLDNTEFGYLSAKETKMRLKEKQTILE